MKRAIALLAAAAFVLPFTACGRRENAALPAEDLPAAETTLPEILPETEERTADTPEVAPETEIPAKAQPADKPQPNYLKVLTNLNVRTGAGTGYPSLGLAQKNTLLSLRADNAGWYETVYRGKKAFVSADPAYTSSVLLDTAEEKIERVIAVGEQFLGTPYVYGAVRLHDGTGRKNKNFTTSEFDCSSLMQYIFYEGAGVLLDVTTRTQIKQGVSVKSGIRRGDLLFFTNASRYNKTGIERVGHVALYLGDNYILHTASDFAKVEQISSTRWSYFLEARRVI